MGNDKGNEVRYIINAKGQQSANLTAKDDGPGRYWPRRREVRDRREGDEGAYREVYASEGDGETSRNDKDNDTDRSYRQQNIAVGSTPGRVQRMSVAPSHPRGLRLITARLPPPTAR